MRTPQTLESGIASHSESHSVSVPQFFQLSHDTVSHAWYAFCVEAIHHPAHKFQLVLKTEINKIGVDEYAVWRNESGVVR